MSLAGRLSAFFLAALAAVLLGFSASLYLLARTYLHRQVDARLEAALDALGAAAEVDEAGVEWEPEARHLTLGTEPGAEQVRWIIRDGRGREVDRSRNAKAGDLPEGWGPGDPARRTPWRLASRRLRAPTVAGSGAPRGEDRHDELILIVAASMGPAAATLRTLAPALAGLSAAVWLLAAAMGRRACRRALAPLTRMATAARAMTADDRDRLPAPGTADELEELSNAFNDLLARLREAYERQRRFAGDASHQLRTPLTALLGQVEVARRRERDADEYRRVLEVVHEEASGLRRIVEALLFLARADAEAELPGLIVVDLASWAHDHLRRWSDHPRGHDLRGEGDGHGPLWARVHPALLAQALDNLLENACKYSRPGTPVLVRWWREAGAACLAVEDRGDGIAPQDLPHVFEPFFRSAEARRQGRAGSGLGLSVAQRIATSLGGVLIVRSELGRGSGFVIRLPESGPPGGPGGAP